MFSFYPLESTQIQVSSTVANCGHRDEERTDFEWFSLAFDELLSDDVQVVDGIGFDECGESGKCTYIVAM